MTVGFGFLDRPSVPEQVRLARRAETLNYSSIWVCETRLARDAISVLGAMAATTERIKLGPGVVNTWNRNPALMAMTFATLNNLAPGRMMLGLGAYWDPLAAKQGITRRKPLTQMREYIDVTRRLLALEEGVSLDGEVVQVEDLTLDLGHGDPREAQDVPIYIGATGPKMMELTGEIADGVIINGLLSPGYVSASLDRIRVGAERAGRDPSEVHTPAFVNVALDEDGEKARLAARRLFAMYLGQQPHIAQASGLPDDFIEEVKRTVGGWPPKPGGLEAALDLVDDELALNHIAAGTADECRQQLERWKATGVDEIVVVPLTDNYDEMIDAFAPSA